MIHGQKCQIQEKWCVGCMAQDLQNDWLVPMFWCVCISMSDQSPSTKWCNKQDCRNQVVQFLTNPFLANFQNGHSPPLYLVGFADCDPRGNPMPPLYRGGMGKYMVKSVKSKRSGVLAACHKTLRMIGQCLCFGVCASMCQISPLVQRCARNKIAETRFCNF